MPPWGAHAVALVAVSLVALLIVRMMRERRNVPLRRQVWAGALRLLAIALFVIVALNPMALRPRNLPSKPRLIVLLDTSASMATKDADGRSRLAAAQQELQSAWDRLNKEFVLDARAFDKGVRPGNVLTSEPIGEGSDIGSALSSAVSELGELPSQAGILLLSDGRATTEGAMDGARLALARAVPLWTHCVGSKVERKDLWVDVASPETLAFADSD